MFYNIFRLSSAYQISPITITGVVVRNGWKGEIENVKTWYVIKTLIHIHRSERFKDTKEVNRRRIYNRIA